jgi:SulP family sulfate permease
MIVTFFISIFQIVISKTKLLKIVEWIHPTAVKGITAGIGISIMLSQIPVILNTQEPLFVPTWEQAKYSLWNHWSWTNIFIFLFTFLIYNLLKYVKNTWVQKLKILISILLSSIILNSVGFIAPQIGNVSFRNVSFNFNISDNVIFVLPYLIHFAIGLAIIAIIQSLLVSEYFAKKEKISIQHSHEIYIQGLTNLVVSLIAFFPVSTSINRSVAHYEAGARDKYSGILSALFVLIMFLVFQPILNMIYLSSLSVMLFIVSTSLIKNLFQEKDKNVAHYILFFCVTTIFINITVALFIGIIFGAYHHISNIKKLSNELTQAIH